MRNAERGEAVTGSWLVMDGMLILDEAEGDLGGGVQFPLTCALTVLDEGFALASPENAERGCGPLDEVVFEAR
jgi:hypothetical protein